MRSRMSSLRRCPRRPLFVERLDDRIVPAGTTIITHGYTATGTPPLGWMHQMGTAVAGRVPAGTAVQQLDFDLNTGKLFLAGSGDNLGTVAVANGFTAVPTTEYIVHTNWGSASNNSVPGWAETAAEGLYAALRRHNLASAGRDLHFIAHSFGTVVNSETVQRLGFFDNLAVDQMTTLDPHDFDEGLVVDTGAKMPDVHVWSNVRYADNYFTLTGGGPLNPHGRSIVGSVPTDLTMKEGFHNGSGTNPHSRVHDYYANTISAALVNVNEPPFGVDQRQWYVGSPEQYGFRYSRLGGATPAQRDAYFSGHMQRTNLISPPVNAQDVGADPPARFVNGDFFISQTTSSPFNELAGYTDAPELVTSAPNFAARLSGSDVSFMHTPVYFPTSATAFTFDVSVATPTAGDTLRVTFQTDTGATVNVTRPVTSVTSTINAAALPEFGQLLGRSVTVGFTLNRQSSSTTAVLIDNLNLNTLPRVVSIVNAGAGQRSRVTETTVVFSGTILMPPNPRTAFQLTRLGPGAPTDDVTLNVDLSGSTATQTVARITFNTLTEHGSLIDGTYRLTVFGAAITSGGQDLDADSDGTPGGNHVAPVHRLFGDGDGDGDVDNLDLLRLRSSFNRSTGQPGFLTHFDWDNDTDVDNIDLLRLRQRFNTSVNP